MSIVITGGTRGIGLAIARRLAKPGETLILGFHTDEAAAALAKAQIELTGATVHTVRADIGSIEGAAELLARASTGGESISCLVHNAAMIYPTSLLHADPAQFTQAVHTNGLSLLFLTQAALPLLRRGSSIILISSAGARQASLGYGALGTAKALAESIMRYLVPELAPLGVRINAVAPGLVRTDSVSGMTGGQEAAERLFERAARTNPSGRLTEADDYTAAVAFLASPEAGFIQGQVIHVNGGSFVR